MFCIGVLQWWLFENSMNTIWEANREKYKSETTAFDVSKVWFVYFPFINKSFEMSKDV